MFYYMSIDKNILLGKEEVTSSNLVIGSTDINYHIYTFIFTISKKTNCTFIALISIFNSLNYFAYL